MLRKRGMHLCFEEFEAGTLSETEEDEREPLNGISLGFNWDL